jgi:hypothetical protein
MSAGDVREVVDAFLGLRELQALGGGRASAGQSLFLPVLLCSALTAFGLVFWGLTHCVQSVQCGLSTAGVFIRNIRLGQLSWILIFFVRVCNFLEVDTHLVLDLPVLALHSLSLFSRGVLFSCELVGLAITVVFVHLGVVHASLISLNLDILSLGHESFLRSFVDRLDYCVPLFDLSVSVIDSLLVVWDPAGLHHE